MDWYAACNSNRQEVDLRPASGFARKQGIVEGEKNYALDNFNSVVSSLGVGFWNRRSQYRAACSYTASCSPYRFDRSARNGKARCLIIF